jgi:flagellar biogenesis protein FliO
MERSEGTRLLQISEGSNEAVSISSCDVQGLAGWALGLFRVWRSKRELPQKQLRLVETLSLGGKRQLMLVTCKGERFLVGTGADSVETIVHLKAETSPGAMATSLDQPCT